MDFTLRSIYRPLYALLALVLVLATGCGDNDPPEFISIEPEESPRGELVVLKGNNLAEIRELALDGEPIQFNTAYNSDVALLWRVPLNSTLGEKTLSLRTDHGSFEIPFKVTTDPPIVRSIFPRVTDIGDTVTIVGENFFEPLEVTFKTGEFVDGEWTDSLVAEVIYVDEDQDSMQVIVPEGSVSGFIRVTANGGTTESGLTWQTFARVLITDFDGNGIFPDNDVYTFQGFSDQGNGARLIRMSLPGPIDGNFMQVTGMDGLGIKWIGGANTPAPRDSFGISAPVSNVFLEMDVNSNGRTDSWLQISFTEQDGRPGEFTHRVKLSESGWTRYSQPLTRFKNSQGFTVRPGRINQIKFHISDFNETGGRIEANVDNVEFVERI